MREGEVIYELIEVDARRRVVETNLPTRLEAKNRRGKKGKKDRDRDEWKTDEGRPLVVEKVVL